MTGERPSRLWWSARRGMVMGLPGAAVVAGLLWHLADLRNYAKYEIGGVALTEPVLLAAAAFTWGNFLIIGMGLHVSRLHRQQFMGTPALDRPLSDWLWLGVWLLVNAGGVLYMLHIGAEMEKSFGAMENLMR